MKIKKITLNNFKRFTDTTIDGLSGAAKVVILAGPNGCGKSSLFDALNVWRRAHSVGIRWDETYHVKQSGGSNRGWNEAVKVEFFDPQPQAGDFGKAIYARSAYRNDPEFQISQLTRTEPATSENRLERLIENDATVSRNYTRLAAQGLEDVYEKEAETTTIKEFRERTIGSIRDAVKRLFPDLALNSLGNPLTVGTFKFDKGVSKGFLYKNLSGGEKAAFDLLLDIIVKKREFDDTVFCIDEPEAHMNTRLQGALLEELYNLLPENSQLWLATHSVGMMRRARDLSTKHPGRFIFLDFDGRDFDKPQVVTPVVPNRKFWIKVLNVALDDLAELVAPDEVVVCEGSPLGTPGRNVAVDAACYNTIFANEFSGSLFLSGGNASDVETDRLALIEAIKALAGGIKVFRLIDRDDLSQDEVTEKEKSGIKVLRRRNIESYLYDDEILDALCAKEGRNDVAAALRTEKVEALKRSVARGNSLDDVKSAAGEIYIAAKRLLSLTKCGNSAKAFMSSTLAPLMSSEMTVYAELKEDIFS